MNASRTDRLITFLQEELSIPAAAIALALKHCEDGASLLPISLWQYGLVRLEELDRIFDWLAAVPPLS
ncbi:hypothetical protein BST81_12110 [Leptolyngbya sp. 'hensonii']|uniref:DUF2949 domain-containing protein n=1 Tax=Leptolyngbya sp. 'hensonii' TaxID=1922337 RepID=UPI00094FC32C|nr:DUF2949 domain-containing protein [Leptolyngbya sp. 'hensonii']OLP17808.1 hypothetical protein BST81_12110 [Leptolyngbya sp. 'hensonii']